MKRLLYLQIQRWFIGLVVTWRCFAIGVGLSQTASKCKHCPDTHEAFVLSVSVAFWTIETGWYMS